MEVIITKPLKHNHHLRRNNLIFTFFLIKSFFNKKELLTLKYIIFLETQSKTPLYDAIGSRIYTSLKVILTLVPYTQSIFNSHVATLCTMFNI